MKKKKVVSFAMAALVAGGVATANAYETSFGGQYRVNSYTLMDDEGVGDLAAARVRIRQNVNIKFSEQFDTHVQLNFGHITEGIGNHTSNTTGVQAGNTVGIRHAVLTYKFNSNVALKTGLVPLSDNFGDTLFSGDWDFNPVTIGFFGNNEMLDWRAVWFKVAENGEVDKVADPDVDSSNDQSGYLAEVTGNLGMAKVGGMLLFVGTPNADADGYEYNAWYGIHADGNAAAINWHASVVGSSLDETVCGVADGCSGVQGLLKVGGAAGTVNWGVLALYSTAGDDDAGDSFFSYQSVYGGQGYWGKTGILNIQGPTDTGMDANMLTSDNGGAGLTTIQASVGADITPEFSAYLGLGWFAGNADETEDLGTDVYVQGKYKFPNSPLAIEFGADVASLGEDHYNSGGESRTATAVFSRIQAEWN